MGAGPRSVEALRPSHYARGTHATHRFAPAPPSSPSAKASSGSASSPSSSSPSSSATPSTRRGFLALPGLHCMHARGGGGAVQALGLRPSTPLQAYVCAPQLRSAHQRGTPRISGARTHRVWRRGGGSAPSAAGPGDADRTYFGGGPISGIEVARYGVAPLQRPLSPRAPLTVCVSYGVDVLWAFDVSNNSPRLLVRRAVFLKRFALSGDKPQHLGLRAQPMGGAQRWWGAQSTSTTSILTCSGQASASICQRGETLCACSGVSPTCPAGDAGIGERRNWDIGESYRTGIVSPMTKLGWTTRDRETS